MLRQAEISSALVQLASLGTFLVLQKPLLEDVAVLHHAGYGALAIDEQKISLLQILIGEPWAFAYPACNGRMHRKVWMKDVGMCVRCRMLARLCGESQHASDE